MAEKGDAARGLATLDETARLAADRRPALVFSRDGARCLWTNPAAGALFGTARFADLAGRDWPGSFRRAVVALAATVPPGGALARLHLTGGASAPVTLCRASLLRLPQGGRGVLVVAMEAIRGTLPDPETFLGAADAPVESLPDTAPASVPLRQETVAAEPEAMEPEAPASPDPEPCEAEVPQPEHRAAPVAARVHDWAPAKWTRAGDLDFTALDAELRRSLGADEAPEPAPQVLRDAEPQPEPEPEPEIVDLPDMPAAETIDAGAADPGAGDAAEIGEPEDVEPEDVGPEDAGPAGPAISAGRVDQSLDRKPVRFLWQTDGADRVLFISPGLAQVVGRNAEIVGEGLEDAAERLRLDPLGRIAAALQRRDTWSGQTAWWPVEGSRVRVPAELTALPVFGPDRSFQGYRGFGVLRPAEALMPAAFEARFGKAPRPMAEQAPPYEEAATTAPANVVPIRAELEKITEFARLTPQERNTFEEIASALRDRIMAGRDDASRDRATEERQARVPRDEEPKPAEAPRPGEGDEDRPAERSGSVRPLFPDRTRPAPRSHAGDAPARGGPARERRARPAPPQPDAPLRPAAKLPPPRRAAPELPAREPQPADDETPALAPSPAPEDPKTGRADLERRIAELAAILDTATDGVLVLHDSGLIESVNASAEALFGLEADELAGSSFIDLLSPESRGIAQDYLNGLRENGVASLLNEGREVEATSGAGSLPLFMTMGRLDGEDGDRFCVVLRDITHWKRAEAELVSARKAAEHASNQKSEFLARVSHEIRTPLNAIIGFAEVMLEEQFGPIENDRYREYLRDIRTSGEHVVSLVNDLLDISKIEAGKLDLNFAAVPLNDVVRECIGLMQPQASRARVVIRSSLAREVPGIVADERTLRQIILNLLSNSVKFTGPGGQVIASTTLAESGEAMLRIRDTGAGMSEEELVRAMEPFRQLSTSALTDRNGTGLGLPLTKALVEANRAGFSIRSTPGEGTIVQVAFPPTRVLSE